MKLNVTAVVVVAHFPIFFCSGDHNQCDRYKFTDGIEIHLSKCIYVNFTKQEPSKMCMMSCTDWTECTGVAVDTNESTAWCCLLNGNPIEISSGQHILYRRMGTPTKSAMFGYKPKEACTDCLQGGIWSGYAPPYGPVQFQLTFQGEQCSTVTGHAEGDVITEGVLNRTTRSATMVTGIRTYEVTVNTENNTLSGLARSNANPNSFKIFEADHVGTDLQY